MIGEERLYFLKKALVGPAHALEKGSPLLRLPGARGVIQTLNFGPGLHPMTSGEPARSCAGLSKSNCSWATRQSKRQSDTRRLLLSETYEIIQVEETILTHYLDALPFPH